MTSSSPPEYIPGSTIRVRRWGPRSARIPRFVIFGGNYWPEPVGIAQYTTPYAEALAAAGHEVTVVSGYPHYPEWVQHHVRPRITQGRRNGVRVLRVPHTVPRRPSAGGRLLLELTYGIGAMCAQPRTGGFDAAIGVVPPLAGGLAAAITARLRRRPYGIVVQDLVSAAALQGGVPGSGRAIVGGAALAERVVFRAKRVAVVARGFEEPVRALGAREVDYLPNFSRLDPGVGDRTAGRTLLGLPDEAFVVLYSGNLGYKQDFESVIAAASLLRDGPAVTFAIIGEGAQRDAIAAAAERLGPSALRLYPLQPEARIPDVLASADLLLAPQRPTTVDMSVPSKLTMYLSAGRPIVAAASGGSETARIVMKSDAGVVVEPGVPQRLASAIAELRAHPERRERYAVAGRSYGKTTFAPEPALERFIAFAERLL